MSSPVLGQWTPCPRILSNCSPKANTDGGSQNTELKKEKEESEKCITRSKDYSNINRLSNRFLTACLYPHPKMLLMFQRISRFLTRPWSGGVCYSESSGDLNIEVSVSLIQYEEHFVAILKMINLKGGVNMKSQSEGNL